MKFLNKFILFILFVGCFYGCDSVSSVELNSSQELNIKNTNIDNLGELEGTFIVKNETLNAKIFSFSSGCQYGFKVEKGDKTLLDSRQYNGCTAALTSFTLKPFESKTFPISFKQISSEIYKKEGSFPEGTYRLVAFLLNDQGPEVSKSFTVN